MSGLCFANFRLGILAYKKQAPEFIPHPPRFYVIRVAHLLSFLCCPIVCFSSVLCCPLRFPPKHDVQFIFIPSCLYEGLCLKYVCFRGVQHVLTINYENNGGCLIRGRNCLPFANSWVHPLFLVRFVLLISLVFCVVFCLSLSCVLCA